MGEMPEGIEVPYWWALGIATNCGGCGWIIRPKMSD
jgi:hypothetical protein